MAVGRRVGGARRKDRKGAKGKEGTHRRGEVGS